MLAYKKIIPCTFLITQVELNKSENMIESTGTVVLESKHFLTLITLSL